jgi:hypothetical protein
MGEVTDHPSRGKSNAIVRAKKKARKKTTRKWYWTKEDIDFLTWNWGIFHTETIARNLGRSLAATLTKGTQLGLRSSAPDGLTMPQLEKRLGVSKTVVLRALEELGVKPPRRPVVQKEVRVTRRRIYSFNEEMVEQLEEWLGTARIGVISKHDWTARGCCKVCKRTDNPHQAKGLCRACYNKQWFAANPTTDWRGGRCKVCGRNSVKHRSRGMCCRCYGKRPRKKTAKAKACP